MNLPEATLTDITKNIDKCKWSLGDMNHSVIEAINITAALKHYCDSLEDKEGDTHKPAIAQLINRYEQRVKNLTGWIL